MHMARGESRMRDSSNTSPGLCRLVVGLVLASCPMGCATPGPPPPTVLHTVASSVRVPQSLERLAILYPRTSNRELALTYARLESAAFQLTAWRPRLRIVERIDLQIILGEHLFEVSGPVSDRSAVRLGRLLGVDGILLYRIDGPTVRDRVLARMYGDFPPFLVTSKIILVESGEVVFHNVVTASVQWGGSEASWLVGESRMRPLIQAALDRGVTQTAVDLERAFQ